MGASDSGLFFACSAQLNNVQEEVLNLEPEP